jgi:hypothetical protein
MNIRTQYSKKNEKRQDTIKLILVIIELIVVVALIVTIIVTLRDIGLAEDYTSDAWIICKPGDYVNVREKPAKNGEIIGRFDCGDKFRTDWEVKNGFVHVFVSLEETEGWIHEGYVSAWEPEWKNGETATIIGDGRVACRRWQDGPRIDGRAGWVQPGTQIQVFYWTPEWCVTNRGYIRTEYLEVMK